MIKFLVIREIEIEVGNKNNKPQRYPYCAGPSPVHSMTHYHWKNIKFVQLSCCLTNNFTFVVRRRRSVSNIEDKYKNSNLRL